MRTSTKNVKRSPGRPRTFDADQVLERVRRVFMEKGFSGASLDDLAAAAGLNRPSLYAAFGNKEQLYIHVLRHYGARILTALNGVLSDVGPIEQRLRRVFTGAINLYTAPPHPPGCLIVGTAAAESPTHPDIASAARDLIGAMEQALERAFAEAAANREIGAEPSPASRAQLVGAVLHTLAFRARIGVEADVLSAFALSMIPVICR